ncbi:class I SAM-dependent methyltransferase [Luminiphilus sp.]|nr:class I SAM-dependent methyltransferase [Luminiphilus sp.]
MKRIIKKFIWDFLKRNPMLFLLVQFHRSRVKGLSDLGLVYKQFSCGGEENSVAVDLGCGPNPRNPFGASKALGVDLYEDEKKGILNCKLGFQKLPFDDGSVDYLTAYDLLEHIPRYSDNNEIGNAPFIFLMNECDRVLRKGGVFLSVTPIFPFLGAFQDPTHNNIMTVDTLKLYFSNEKSPIASHYGINTNFVVAFQRLYGQHLVVVLRK